MSRILPVAATAALTLALSAGAVAAQNFQALARQDLQAAEPREGSVAGADGVVNALNLCLASHSEGGDLRGRKSRSAPSAWRPRRQYVAL